MRAQAAWHRGPGVAAIHGILLCGGSGIPSSGRLATLTMLLLDDAGGALAGEAEARPREPALTLLIGLPGRRRPFLLASPGGGDTQSRRAAGVAPAASFAGLPSGMMTMVSPRPSAGSRLGGDCDWLPREDHGGWRGVFSTAANSSCCPIVARPCWYARLCVPGRRRRRGKDGERRGG